MGNLFNSLNKLKSNIFGGPGNTGFTKPPATRVAKLGIEDTPTSLLSVDPLAFATFSYPKDVTNNMENGHYMLFYVNVQNRSKFQYQNPEGKPVPAVRQVKVKTFKHPGGPPNQPMIEGSEVRDMRGETGVTVNYYTNRAAKAGQIGSISDGTGGGPAGGGGTLKSGKLKASQQTGIAAKAKTTTRVSDSVAIYLPPNVQDNTTATYNDMQTGMLGYAAATGLDFTKFMGTKDYEGAAKALTAGLAGFATEAAKKAAAGLAETLAGAEGATQLANRVFGQADNPYMEVLFESMGIRQFTYNFTFAPRNEEERDDVQSIIQLFRFHMAPELQGGQSRFLTLPSEFDIHYMYQAKDGTNSENDYYNKIATCVLENVAVDYTPGQVRSFKDGSPTQITMALTFKETETLTKDKINAGY